LQATADQKLGFGLVPGCSVANLVCLFLLIFLKEPSKENNPLEFT
jgi:hypothetical protein